MLQSNYCNCIFLSLYFQIAAMYNLNEANYSRVLSKTIRHSGQDSLNEMHEPFEIRFLEENNLQSVFI